MKLPTEKLEEIEYYEKHLDQGHDAMGRPYAKDVFIFHYGEWEKEWKFFGWTVWTETFPDRTERLEFERSRIPNGENENGDDMYKLRMTESVRTLNRQLKAYFDNEFSKVYNALIDHEIDYMTS